MAQGYVGKYETASGLRWRITYDLGPHVAQRCAACRRRFWVDGPPRKACPKCRGALTETCERRQVTRRGFARERDAQRELRSMVQRVDDGAAFAPQRTTLAEYLREWLAGIKRKPTTYAQYRQSAECYVIPRIGGVRLQALTAEHLDRLYRELERSGRRRDGGPLAPKSVRHVHTMLRKALQDATRRGHVLRNVADLANPPTAGQTKSHAARDAVWTADQLRSLLAHVADDRLYAGWRLLVTTGMRRGELMGLRWVDVDLDAGTVRVGASTVTMAAGVAVWQSDGKSDAAGRTVALDVGTVEALRTWKVRQAAERLLLGPAWIEDAHGPLVFTAPSGAALHSSTLLKALHRHADACGLPRITVHGLRHSYATAARRAGVDVETLSRRLGHADVAITLNIYRHLDESDDRQAADLAAASITG